MRHLLHTALLAALTFPPQGYAAHQKTSEWLNDYNANGHLNLPSNYNAPTIFTHSNWYYYQMNAHVRLDCTVGTKTPHADIPFCNTLMTRTHCAQYRFSNPSHPRTFTGTEDECIIDTVRKGNSKVVVGSWTTFEAVANGPWTTSPDAALKKAPWGDVVGMPFPNAAMDPTPGWLGQSYVQNDTSCLESTVNGCRKDMVCRMTWLWADAKGGYANRDGVPKDMYSLGHCTAGGHLSRDTYQATSQLYTVGPMANSGSSDEYDFYNSDSPAFRWASGGDESCGAQNQDAEFCRMCALTTCPETRTAEAASDAIAAKVTCKAGYAQAFKVQPWMAADTIIPGNTEGACSRACPMNTWMTCPSDTDTCAYNPQRADESFQAWHHRVILTAGDIITIPHHIDPDTGDHVYWQKDLTECFPCKNASGYRHYGKLAGDYDIDTDSADYYCPGGSKPPIKCKDTDTPHARADMKPGSQAACQCQGGYYSSVAGQYKKTDPGKLNCIPCEAGYFCRFRAEAAAGPGCPAGQQRCQCPDSQFSKPGATECTPCNTEACAADDQARTACLRAYPESQTEDSTCIACAMCMQLAGTVSGAINEYAVPCYNMVNLSAVANANIPTGTR
jgi:hypothetical protein